MGSLRFPNISSRSLPTLHVVNGREQFGDNARAASTNAASSISTHKLRQGHARKFCVADSSVVNTSASRQRAAFLDAAGAAHRVVPPARRLDCDSVWGLLDCNGDGELERNELERGLRI